jgi:hypothetical protein
MTKVSETGHAKNVANFSQLTVICTSYGTKYNPSNPALQLQSMGDAAVQTKSCISAIHDTQALFSKALSERGQALKPLSMLVTRINMGSNRLLSQNKPKIKLRLLSGSYWEDGLPSA